MNNIIDSERSSKRLANIVAVVGILSILAPYWGLSAHTQFPGATAVPSVLGTALLIRFGQLSWVGRALEWRPFIEVGLISYSLYLWHWPVTVFWRYAVYDQLCVWDYVGMLVVSLMLAYLSWRFVEVPVRTSASWTTRKSFLFAGTGTVLLVFVGAACSFQRGWPTILHPQANKLTAEINIQTSSSLESGLSRATRFVGSLLGQIPSQDEITRRRLLAGLPGDYALGALNQPEIALIGDSHAGALGAALDLWLRKDGRGGLLLTQSATPMFDLSLPQCREALLELQKHSAVKKIVLVQGWFYLFADNAESDTNLRKLEEFAHEIHRRQMTLYITSDVPIFNGTDIAAKSAIIAPRRMEIGWDGTMTKVQYDEAQGQINSRLLDVCSRTGAVFIPTHLAFMKGKHFVAFEEHNDSRIPLFRNIDHVSLDGGILAIRFMMPYLFASVESDASMKN